MLKCIKKGIIKAIIYAAIAGGAIYGIGFLGIKCVEFTCGSCIPSSTYNSWSDTSSGLAKLVALFAGAYGLVYGIAEAKKNSDTNLENSMNGWNMKANQKINEIEQDLSSNRSANNKIKDCIKFINTREKWMTKKFIKNTVEPKTSELRNVIFSFNGLDSNVNGVYELERLIKILEARDTYNGKQDYKDNIKNIRELINYIDKTTSNMIELEPYGKMKNEFSKAIEKYNNIKEELYNDVCKKENMLFSNTIGNVSILRKDLFEKIEVCLYYTSHETPYNADKFNRIQKLYDYFKNKYFNIQKYSTIETITFKAPDSIYTEMYTYKMMGETVLKNNKKNVMSQVENSIACNVSKEASLYIAAALMNIGLYDIEKEILTYYVSQGINVNETIQKRIKYLETDTRNGKVGTVHEINSDGFAYDFASSNWSDEDMQAFFKNLAYQEKKLNYSLVIEDWKKTLPITGKIKISDQIISEEIAKMLEDEYDNEIYCKVSKTIALSESSFEEQEAILFRSNSEEYNKDITFILSCIKVGKSLNIRIFTLFTPNSQKSTEEDLKEAIAIKKGLNPKNTAYIEGLRDSILRRLEDYLKKETTSNDIY